MNYLLEGRNAQLLKNPKELWGYLNDPSLLKLWRDCGSPSDPYEFLKLAWDDDPENPNWDHPLLLPLMLDSIVSRQIWVKNPENSLLLSWGYLEDLKEREEAYPPHPAFLAFPAPWSPAGELLEKEFGEDFLGLPGYFMAHLNQPGWNPWWQHQNDELWGQGDPLSRLKAWDELLRDWLNLPADPRVLSETELGIKVAVALHNISLGLLW